MGAGPGSNPLTIDVDSTICETYGLLKQGATGFADTGVRDYHPLLATAAGTGDVLHARLRGGSANSGRGAAGFVAETVSRGCGAGATDVVETTYTPFSGRDAKPVRLIVRRVRPTPGSQLAIAGILFRYHAFITDRIGDTVELEADHRRHAEVWRTRCAISKRASR